jgi:hypothetical protein
VIVHSYIGQQPVYSEVLRCHIYPTPPAKVTMVEIEIDRPEERRAIYRPLVEDCLSQNGPLTARMIAEKTGLQKHQVNSALESKKGLLFSC